MRTSLPFVWATFIACGSQPPTPTGDPPAAATPKLDSALAAAADRAPVRAACDRGDARACWTMAKLALYGWTREPDELRLRKDLEAACSGGLGFACVFIADVDATRGDLVENGMALAERACEGGDGEACLWFGTDLINGKRGPNRGKDGLAAVIRGCDDLGYAQACTQVGSIWEQGWLGDNDNARAMRWYQQGCERGDATGCYYASNFIAAGTLTPADPTAALSLRQRACELGLPEACAHLAADALVAGPIGSGDGLAWARRACERELVEGCALLAVHMSPDPAADDRVVATCTNDAARFGGEVCMGAARKRAETNPGEVYDVAVSACFRHYAAGCQLALAHPPAHLSPTDREQQRMVLLERACAFNDEAACATLEAQCVQAPDTCPSRARDWGAKQRAACWAGDVQGCYYTAYLLRESRALFMMWRMNGARDTRAIETAVEEEVQRLLRHAENLGRKACDAQDGAACLALSELYSAEQRQLLPPVLRVDADAYSKTLERACGLRSPEACVRLAEVIDADAAHALHIRATEAADQACAKNDAAACLWRAQQQDGAERTKTRKRSCELGHAAGCLALADEVSEAEAAKLKARACKLGDDATCAALTEATRVAAKGPAQAKAQAALEALCDKGNRDACGFAWQALDQNDDGPRIAALKLKGCRAGHLTSCMTLGMN